MPNARTHDAITIVTGLALAPLTYGSSLAGGHLPATAGMDTLLLVGSHLLSGIMFSPDLDIDSAIDNRWGIFYWIWRPYMWITPHRRWFSHGLIFPPLLRLLYFWVMLTLTFTVVAWLLAQIGVIVPDYPAELSSYLLALGSTYPRQTSLCIIGFITGGAAHSIADWLSTRGKNILRALGLRVPKNRGGDRY